MSVTKCIRIVGSSGNQLRISIPPTICKHLKLKAGDAVYLAVTDPMFVILGKVKIGGEGKDVDVRNSG